MRYSESEVGRSLPQEKSEVRSVSIDGIVAFDFVAPANAQEAAEASGTVSKAGGMVVKNVSGYDMPRLYLGSLGTLGVVVSANFKVLPRPRAEATVITAYDEPVPAFSAANDLRDGRCQPAHRQRRERGPGALRRAPERDAGSGQSHEGRTGRDWCRDSVPC